MKQLVFIHGGEAFNTYEGYISYLQAETYEPFPEPAKRWKEGLREALGDEWEVFLPSMPLKYNAKYREWSIWFQKVIPYLRDDVVLVGHSLGGIFLAKFLSEHTLPVSIHSTHLVAAVATEGTEDLADFVLPESLILFEQQGGKIFLYHSTDDSVVPYSDVEVYKSLLPGATVRTFTDRGHFFGPEFPEIVMDILTA